MSRVAYERVFGQSGYDAVARNKIKKLEEKMDGGSGGSGGVFYIRLTLDPDVGFVADKTPEEIFAAYENGMLPVVVGEEFEGLIFHLVSTPTSRTHLVFNAIRATGVYGEIDVYTLHIKPDGTIRMIAGIMNYNVDFDSDNPPTEE